MKTEIKQLPKSEVEILIELDPTEWGKFVDEATRTLARDVKIEGFRPGNAPKEMVEQKIGQGHILEAAAGIAVRKTYIKVLEEKNIDAIGRPEVHVLKVAMGNPFEFKIKTAVLPPIKLADYKKIAKSDKPKTKDKIKVEEKEIQDSLNWLKKSRTKYATVVRPAQKGDRVEVDFIAKQDGKMIANGESKNHPLVIGEGKFVPGFEDQLVGLKENETKSFSLVFPENFAQKDLAGKLIEFEVKMNLVQEPQMPELNDKFAKSLGKFDTIDALKANIKEGMAIEKENKEKDIWRAKVLQEIVKKSSMEMPEILIQAEVAKMAEEFKENLMQMGLEYQQYLKNIKKTEEEMKKDWLPKAVERAQAGLILRAIADQEKLEVTAQEAEEEVNHIIKHYPDWDAVKEKIDMDQLAEYTKNRLKNEKVFEFLEKI
ncbi:MAG: trigger factor [Candidatus Portnoybacteria bacterium]|nr:trigger factor [Candidatus Portnoybacteria bacterium]MDD4982802.1 trigger factor [Candidatus Portnoybacteria bacterium]